jgi:2',3'-cyclic-nucleotide 2'-phosphodiesterase (5'-nucleotidase family)
VRRSRLAGRAAFAACALVAALAAPPLARAATAHVTIIHTNDFHSTLARGERVIATIRQLRTLHPQSILLDAGDAFESQRPGAVANGGGEMVEFMNRAGYDGYTLGDNEFVDFRLADVLANVKRFRFPVISANLRVEGRPIALPFFVYQRDGATIGVIGIYGDHKALARFGVEELSSKKTIAYWASLLKNKVDCLVLLSHAGFEREHGYAEAVPDLDVIIGGSTHAPRAPELVGRTLIVRAAARGLIVGSTELEIDTEKNRVTSWRFEPVDTELAAGAR